MIKMHCDRCDKSEAVHWTKGSEKGEPVIPQSWGEVRAPETPSSLVTYVLCDTCLADFHVWVKGPQEDEEDDHPEGFIYRPLVEGKSQ